MRKKRNIIDSLYVQSPCTVGFENMEGNERVRFCRLCQLNVYNLAEMTDQEVKTLLAASDNKLCVRMYRRADGTVVTDNCPRALRRLRNYLRVVVAACALIIAWLTGTHPTHAQGLVGAPTNGAVGWRVNEIASITAQRDYKPLLIFLAIYLKSLIPACSQLPWWPKYGLVVSFLVPFIFGVLLTPFQDASSFVSSDLHECDTTVLSFWVGAISGLLFGTPCLLLAVICHAKTTENSPLLMRSLAQPCSERRNSISATCVIVSSIALVAVVLWWLGYPYGYQGFVDDDKARQIVQMLSASSFLGTLVLVSRTYFARPTTFASVIPAVIWLCAVPMVVHLLGRFAINNISAWGGGL